LGEAGRKKLIGWLLHSDANRAAGNDGGGTEE
jgi:hypothetical protein